MAAAVSKAFGATNQLLIHNPEQALIVAGGLVALGGSLKLIDVFRHVGVESVLTDEERLEVEMLDEIAPSGFFHRAAHGVYDSLRASIMVGGSVKPKVYWHHNDFKVGHHLERRESNLILDVTDVSTPKMEDGKLV